MAADDHDPATDGPEIGVPGDEGVVPGLAAPLDLTGAETLAADPPVRRRIGKRTAVVTAVALGVAAGGGAIAYAAGGHGTPAGPGGRAAGAPGGPGGGPGGFGGYGGFGGGQPGGTSGGTGGTGGTGNGYGYGGTGGTSGGTGGTTGGPRGGAPFAAAGAVVHGTFVVSTTETDDVQRGTVTAVGASAITLTSADGFAKTYVLGSGSKVDGGQGKVSDLKTGDTVSVIATDSGGTATVTEVFDQSQVKKPAAPSSTTSPEATAPTTAPSPGSGRGTGTPPAGAGAGGVGPDGGFGGFAGDALVFRSLHGTYVVAKTSGTTTTYATDVVQTGSVTALSATSVALKSTDGYTATYVITASTTKDSSVATGKDVTVVSTGSPATASSIRTGGKPGGFSGGPGGAGGAGGGMPGGWGGYGGGNPPSGGNAPGGGQPPQGGQNGQSGSTNEGSST